MNSLRYDETNVNPLNVGEGEVLLDSSKKGPTDVQIQPPPQVESFATQNDRVSSLNANFVELQSILDDTSLSIPAATTAPQNTLQGFISDSDVFLGTIDPSDILDLDSIPDIVFDSYPDLTTSNSPFPDTFMGLDDNNLGQEVTATVPSVTVPPSEPVQTEDTMAYPLERLMLNKPRKRDISESSLPQDLRITSNTSTDGNDSEKRSSRKKQKMYELDDKSNPLVQRAGYAKSYREKKKHENESLRMELQSVKDDRDQKMEKIAQLQKTNAKKDELLQKTEASLAEKTKEIQDLKEALNKEKEQNALNPQQTEHILTCIKGAVEAACPSNVTAVKVVVNEQLANKRCTALPKKKIQAIYEEEMLRNQSCTFTFDMDDETNKLIVRKH